MRADRCRQNSIDSQLRDDAEQDGVDAGCIGIRQFSQVADTHHDLDIGIAFSQTLVADDGLSQAERDRVKNSIGNKRLVFFLHRLNRPVQRRDITGS
jgi:hypothetical protein